MTQSKRKPASRRVAWPEPGRDSGGEFRLTWGRLAAIVGIEIEVTRLDARWKLSQDRQPQERAAIIAALRASANGAAIATADLMQTAEAGR